jgi:hypothetical protein
MALDLRHDAAYHTNGRLGMFFSQTTIEVYELVELSGNVERDPDSSGVSSDCSPLSGSVEIVVGT